MLATLDNVQPAADVSANDSALNAARTDAVAAQAAVNTAAADLNQAEAEYEHAKLDYDRNKALYDAQLIAKSDYDTKKAAYRHGHRAVGNVQSQAGASQGPTGFRAGPHQAERRQPAPCVTDVLSKTEYEAPFDGVITNVPGARRRNRGPRHPELTRQHADDDCRHLGDYRRSEGRRDRHRQRASWGSRLR